MILHYIPTNHDEQDSLDLKCIANEYITNNDARRCTFATFRFFTIVITLILGIIVVSALVYSILQVVVSGIPALITITSVAKGGDRVLGDSSTPLCGLSTIFSLVQPELSPRESG